MVDDNLSRRQLLAAILAGGGARVGAIDDDEEPDTDAQPVPTEPGTPYVPLVNRPPPRPNYEPPWGPPPWGPSGNGFPAQLASTRNVGLPSSARYSQWPGAAAPIGNNQNPLAGLLSAIGIGAGATPQATPPAAPAARPANVAQADVADNGETKQEDATLAAYRALYNSSVASQKHALAMVQQTAGTPAADVYLKIAEDAAKAANDVNLKAIEYGKPPQTVNPGQWVRNVTIGKYEQPVPAELSHIIEPEEAKEKGLTGAVYEEDPKGVITPIAGTEEAKDSTNLQEWKAENEDNKSRGLPEIPFRDFLANKRAYGGASSNLILDKAGNPIDENLPPEDVYKTVPATVARMAKGMVDGTIKIPALGIRTDQTAKQALLVAQMADPSLLDVNKVAARRVIEAGYSNTTPGTLGGQVDAGNTAADHLADVIEAAENLKNTSGGGIPVIAHIANALRNNMTTGQAGKAGELEDGLLHYGEEIAKFYAGTQTGETERLRFLIALSNCKSRQEMAGVFRMEARQLGGKFITLDEQVRNVMGEEGAKRYPVVRASTNGNAERITAGLAALDSAGPEATSGRSPTDRWPGITRTAHAAAPAVAPQQNAPVTIHGDADYNKVRSGETYIGPDGQMRVKR